jgi:peptidoglycan/LPS O-acetylase OafA/YrhL
MAVATLAENRLLTQTKPKTKRILELDALRALAALNLLVFHFTYVYGGKYGFASPLGFAFPYGKYGVELFFILSGFVNAMTLLRKRKPADFLVGRCIRILPSYWLVILLNLVLLSLVPMFGETVTLDATAANLTVMPGLFGFHNMEPVTWTLQIEMLFYGMLLLMLVTGILDKPFVTMMAGMVVCLSGALGTQWMQANFPDWIWTGRAALVQDILILKWLPLFSMGILLNEIKSKRGRLWLNLVGILISAVVFHIIDLKDHNPLATALLFGLVALSAYGKLPPLRAKPLMFIGTISYSLYLFHDNLGSALIRQLENWGCGPLTSVMLATVFSIGLAAAITYWLEQPVTKWLNQKWADAKAWYAGRGRQELSSRAVTPLLIVQQEAAMLAKPGVSTEVANRP